jgi:hypothetical protein
LFSSSLFPIPSLLFSLPSALIRCSVQKFLQGQLVRASSPATHPKSPPHPRDPTQSSSHASPATSPPRQRPHSISPPLPPSHPPRHDVSTRRPATAVSAPGYITNADHRSRTVRTRPGSAPIPLFRPSVHGTSPGDGDALRPLSRSRGHVDSSVKRPPSSLASTYSSYPRGESSLLSRSHVGDMHLRAGDAGRSSTQHTLRRHSNNDLSNPRNRQPTPLAQNQHVSDHRHHHHHHHHHKEQQQQQQQQRWPSHEDEVAEAGRRVLRNWDDASAFKRLVQQKLGGQAVQLLSQRTRLSWAVQGGDGMDVLHRKRGDWVSTEQVGRGQQLESNGRLEARLRNSTRDERWLDGWLPGHPGTRSGGNGGPGKRLSVRREAARAGTYT